jgi:hypothetical protein
MHKRLIQCGILPRKVFFMVIFIALMSQMSQAWAYGDLGHQTIGAIADAQLTPEARAAIRSLLRPTETLPTIATWPDDLKRAKKDAGPLAHDPEAEHFNQAFPDNREWHYVDLPLDTAAYTNKTVGSRPNDIVHTIRRCVTVLEAKTVSPSEMTRTQALRWLVHLLGDLHQPLHVGSGYYRFDDHRQARLITDPHQAAGKEDDHGGNLLFYEAEEELHAFWDHRLVAAVAKGRAYQELAVDLLKHGRQPAWDGSGSYHRWVDQWAIEAVREGKAAYERLAFGAGEFGGPHDELQKITITLAPGYEEDEAPFVEHQLAKAGYRLAALLNAIRWPPAEPSH